MNDYIAKPVEKKLLIRMLGKWVLRMSDYHNSFEERLSELGRSMEETTKQAGESAAGNPTTPPPNTIPDGQAEGTTRGDPAGPIPQFPAVEPRIFLSSAPPRLAAVAALRDGPPAIAESRQDETHSGEVGQAGEYSKSGTYLGNVNKSQHSVRSPAGAESSKDETHPGAAAEVRESSKRESQPDEVDKPQPGAEPAHAVLGSLPEGIVDGVSSDAVAGAEAAICISPDADAAAPLRHAES
ncbi:hypothetical protein VTK56DRAFT_3531 [Thermocarpiscus australiensis]